MLKGVCKSYKNRKERFFETHAFAVCVNRPLAYVIYADGGGFLAPAVFRQPHSVSKNKFFDTLKSAGSFEPADLSFFCHGRNEIFDGVSQLGVADHKVDGRGFALGHHDQGSTTYTLLDTLINKNDALTPTLDDNGKPYFRSYGDAVAAMSGEVKNYTSHWNLKSSGDYKGSVASTDKDVDDSTNSRLGEYDGSPTFEDLMKDPVGWLKRLLGMGGTAFLLLLFLLSILGFSGGKYDGAPDPDPIKFKICWGLITVDYNKMLKATDRNRAILENLDKLSSLQIFDKFGKYGELFDAGVGVSKALQKAADVYGETGNWREALVRGAGSFGAGQLMGKATKADPSLAIWDIATAEIFKGSAAADMVNAGNNAESLFDYFLDLAHTASSDTRAEGTMDAVFGGKAMSCGELADKMMNGDYGDNIKNLVDAEDILLAENNGDLYDAVFGEEGMGIGEFLMGFGDTAEDALIKGNGSAERGLENYRKLIERFYAGKGGAK